MSWLPFYHDMGLMLAMREPILLGFPSVIMSPVAFLQRPARWMQLLANNSHAFSAAPNFAFEIAARKISDADMAGLDLGDVLGIVTGSERVHPASLRRFTQRFTRFGLPERAIRPSYGLAEATVYVATHAPGRRRRSSTSTPRNSPKGTRSRRPMVGHPLVSYGCPSR